jgi:hypothetical protein
MYTTETRPSVSAENESTAGAPRQIGHLSHNNAQKRSQIALPERTHLYRQSNETKPFTPMATAAGDHSFRHWDAFHRA